MNIKTGARVMITLNVNTSDSIVNGSLGVVEDVITDKDENARSIIVQFDNSKSGVKQREKYGHIADKYKQKNGTPIFKSKIRYHLSGSRKRAHATTATVFQFPIRLAFAITGHKMQGQTIRRVSKVVVNWKKRMPPSLAYVSCQDQKILRISLSQVILILKS